MQGILNEVEILKSSPPCGIPVRPEVSLREVENSIDDRVNAAAQVCSFDSVCAFSYIEKITFLPQCAKILSSSLS